MFTPVKASDLKGRNVKPFMSYTIMKQKYNADGTPSKLKARIDFFGLRRFFDEILIEINSANISQTRKGFWIWILLALSLFNYGFNALPTVFFGARTIKFELRGVATFGTTIAKRGDNTLTKVSIDKHSGLINTLINYKNMNVANIFEEMKALSSNQRTSFPSFIDAGNSPAINKGRLISKLHALCQESHLEPRRTPSSVK